jgi:CBS domain-containing protein
MIAADIMTRSLVTVTPDTPLPDVIRTLLDKRIGAVPVVEGGAVVGLVSEGDLLHRAELGAAPHAAGWLRLFTSEASRARDFVRDHGTLARDVMTHPAVTVAEDTPVGEIAALLERRAISRVPVVDGNRRLLGIVSRSDILRALASRLAPHPAYHADDRRLREAVLAAVDANGWAADASDLTVLVEDGIVHLWGSIGADPVHRALVVAAAEVPGVLDVRDHLSPWHAPDPMDRPHWQEPAPL